MEDHPLWIAASFGISFGALILFFAGISIIKTEFDDLNVIWIMAGVLLVLFGVIFIHLDGEFYQDKVPVSSTTKHVCLFKSNATDMKRIHLFRPDLIPYPIPWETYS